MAFEVNSFCDLCCQPVTKGRRMKFLDLMKFPGCHGLPSVLNEHLVVYFVVKKLLELKDEQFLELVSGDVDKGLGRNCSNCFCDKCEDVIIEAFELQMKVVDLQRNIKKLGKMLKELLKLSWKESCNASGSLKGKDFVGNIRKFMCNEELTDKTNVKTEDNPVKAELYDEEPCNQEDFLEEDSYMDSFSNTQSDAENDSILPHLDDRDEEKASVPSKRRRKSINPSDDDEDNATASDDSDYRPQEEAAKATSLKLGRGAKRKSLKLQRKTGYHGTSSFGNTCHICGMFQKTPNGFRNHMSVHEESTEKYGNKYDCPKCKYPTISEFKLRFHLTKAHQETHNNTCSVCGFVGSRRWIYDKHMLEKHGIQVWTPIDEPKEKKAETDKPLKCKLKLSKAENENTCHICGIFRKTVYGYRQHMSVHEESTKKYGNKYDCPKCKFPTISEVRLRLHLTKAHQETHNNKCSICGFVGSRRWNYDKHMFDKHNIQVWTPIDDPKEEKTEVDKPSPLAKACNICGMVQKSPNGFRNHMNVHKESTEVYGNKFDCPKCKYPTISESKLRYHMTKAHQETHNNTCSVCGFVGSRRWIYDKHMLEKHGIQVWTPIDEPNEKKPKTERPLKRKLKLPPVENENICHICGMFQKTVHGFRQHMSVHEESTKKYGNKYDCPKCKYPTISESRLRFHMSKAHQVTNNNTRSICGYVGSRRHHYDKHMLDKHGIQAWTPIDDPSDDTAEQSSSLATDEGEPIIPRKDRSLLFQCERCTAFYKTTQAFERHQKTHKLSSELDNKFDCDVCGFPTISEKLLERHKRRVHKPQTMYTCSICDYEVTRFSQLKMHVQKYHKHDKKLRSTCSICQKTFCRPHLLKVHMIVHQKHDQSYDSTTGIFSCNLCDFKVKTLRGLETHVSGVHRFANISREAWKLSQDSMVCSQCGRSFLSKDTLRRHVRTIHEGKYTNRYRCEVCGTGFEAKCFLERHLKTHNPVKEKEFVCEICGAAYIDKASLTKHTNKFHLGLGSSSAPPQKMLNCKFCNDKYPYKHLLDNHLRKAHEGMFTFKCDLCEKSYISGSSLRLHKEIHHSKGAGAGAHACEYCEKQFPHKHNVLNHYRCCSQKKKLLAKQQTIQ